MSSRRSPNNTFSLPVYRCFFFSFSLSSFYSSFFFFNDTATTEIYTLSLHDALPISGPGATRATRSSTAASIPTSPAPISRDRKSTRLNSSHLVISYAVFCLKKKKKNIKNVLQQNLQVTQYILHMKRATHQGSYSLQH